MMSVPTMRKGVYWPGDVEFINQNGPLAPTQFLCPLGTTHIDVRCAGGGGGGSNWWQDAWLGGGGGSGGYTWSGDPRNVGAGYWRFTVAELSIVPGQLFTVQIGGLGANGNGPTNAGQGGGNGGITTLGAGGWGGGFGAPGYVPPTPSSGGAGGSPYGNPGGTGTVGAPGAGGANENGIGNGSGGTISNYTFISGAPGFMSAFFRRVTSQTFLNNGAVQQFTVPQGISRIRISACAGGGSGGAGNSSTGSNGGGGGGAGELIPFGTIYPVSPGQVIDVFVGAGGATPGNYPNQGNPGQESYVAGFITTVNPGQPGQRGDGVQNNPPASGGFGYPSGNNSNQFYAGSGGDGGYNGTDYGRGGRGGDSESQSGLQGGSAGFVTIQWEW